MSKLSSKANDACVANYSFDRWSSRNPKGSARQTFAAVTLAAMTLLLNRTASADLNWDPTHTDSVNGGGSGTWDTTTANWYSGSTDVAFYNTSSTNAIFGGPSGNFNVSVSGPITVGNITFNNTSAGSGTVYNLLAPVSGSTVPTELINLASSAPVITVNGTSYLNGSYPTDSASSGYALIGNTQAVGTTAPLPTGGAELAGSHGFTLTGGRQRGQTVDCGLSEFRKLTAGPASPSEKNGAEQNHRG